ncbi:unnamed protein product [Miscanthus lutarioriparius]|uniref:No apical meristem-associated C-terminal domain-containing protein n=1 Tax=Miscanthus lutarioriparius TaxID=422564 RepID=A0A811NNC8_9POAL|nr:unnamed protein product [Miscanthus lutarioriparius]
MDSGRSFTDMIMQGFTPAAVSNNIPLRNDVQARDEVAAAVKGIQKRSKNFTVKKDKMLVSAWLNDFPVQHCWKILKNHSKWTHRRQQIEAQKPFSKKQKTTTSSTPATDVAEHVTGTVDETHTAITTVDRPTRTKKEKQKLKQRSSIEALDYLLAKKKEVDAEKEMKKEERELKKEERGLKKHEMLKKPLLCRKKG